MTCKVVHFSTSPLAGAPMRIVSALREYSRVDARLVDLDDWGLFENDVVTSTDLETAVKLAEDANIIHLHNCIDLDDARFAPINFRELAEKGKIFVRQYHSPADAIAMRLGKTIDQLIAEPMATMVVAQYHERFFPHSRVVPNIVDHHKGIYNPGAGECTNDLFFGYAIAYKPVGTWQNRWATKAAGEISTILEDFARTCDAKICIACDMPHSEMTRLRSGSRIVIDETVTGSYHISALEALAAGRVAISYLDQRCSEVFSYITGSTELPFINTAIENLRDVVKYLLDRPELCKQIGMQSRQWFEKYYAPEKMIQHYVNAYNELIENCGKLPRQNNLKIESQAKQFFSRELPEVIYQSRRKKFSTLSITQKIKKLLGMEK